MTDHEQHRPAPAGDGSTPPARRGNRRRLALIGAGGAAVILAGGALLATQAGDADQQSLSEPAVIAPKGAATSSPAPSASMEAVPSSATPTAAETSPAAEPSEPAETKADRRDGEQAEKPEDSPRKVREEVEKARAKAAEDGVTLKRPLEQKDDGGGFTQRTETTEDGSIRITTARHDLTGRPPLTIAADRGTREGSARCTNKIRFSEGVPAQERPTLLLCWRTSGKRSVVTMAVTPEGKPKTATSVKLIEREWAKLD